MRQEKSKFCNDELSILQIMKQSKHIFCINKNFLIRFI